MRSRYQKRLVAISGETDAAYPCYTDRWRIEVDGVEIEAGERLQFERLPQMLARAVVGLDQRRDPGHDRDLDIRRSSVATLCSVPGQTAADRLLADNDRTFADGLAHRGLIDDVIGAGHPEIELDDRLVDLFRQLSCEDRGDDILDGRRVGVHDHVAFPGVGGDDEGTSRVGVWISIAELRLLEQKRGCGRRKRVHRAHRVARHAWNEEKIGLALLQMVGCL